MTEYAEYGSEVYAPLTRNGFITRDKMAHLYETRPAQLQSLDGLSTRGLTHLYLQNNQLVATLELGLTLSTLTQLQKLYISGNRLADLTPLCGLLSLEELHAGSQRTGDELVLPPDLERLGRLRVLSLPHNRLCDVSALGGCRRLESLDLSANSGITDMKWSNDL